MHRLFRAIFASAMAAAFLFAGPAIAKTSSMTGSMTTHHSHMTKHSCPAGEHWVKGYKRNGKYVKGYCRK